MISGTLFASVLPEALPGELLSSLLVRAAHRRGESPARLVSGHWPETSIWDRDIDRFASDEMIARFADLGVQLAERLGAATLRREALALGGASVAASGGGAAATAPMIMSLGVRRFRRRRHGLAFCSLCLTEQPGVYLKDWRLAFAIACPAHGVWLRDACPRCDAPVEPHRNLSLRCDRCATCAAPLSAAPTIPADSRFASFQRELSAELGRAVAGASPDASANVGELTTATLARVRALCAVASDRAVAPRLADALGFAFCLDGHAILRVEHMRIHDRRALLGLVAAWCDDWPSRFLTGAAGAGLTHRSFSRLRLPPDLAVLVQRLPPRSRGHTDRGPRVHDLPTRRLRRRGAQGYAAQRAERVLAAIQPRG